MILRGMTLGEVKVQLMSEREDVRKLRKEAAKALSRHGGDHIHMSGISNKRNLYYCKAYKVNGNIRTMVICVAPLMGKSDDYIIMKGDNVVVFTAHAVKRLKERLEVEGTGDIERTDRKIRNAMILASLFGENESYPGMAANTMINYQQDLRMMNARSDNGKGELFYLVRCRICALVVKIIPEEGYVVKTIISDKMASEEGRRRFERINAIFAVISSAHMMLNRNMYQASLVNEQRRTIAKAVKNGMNPILFNFPYFPRSRKDKGIAVFRLGDITGDKVRNKATIRELIDFCDDQVIDINDFLKL